MRLSLSFFLLLSAITGELKAQSTLDKLNWLVGAWTYTTDDWTYHEEWTVKDEQYSGESYFINKEGKKVATESLEIKMVGGSPCLIVTINGQNDSQPITYKIVTITDTSFIAKNPDHDFPQKIEYILTGKNTIKATVSDGVKPLTYHFKRTTN